MRQELIGEALLDTAKIALLLEDNAPELMGSDYSVNINFRRDGGDLHTSIEIYGATHASGYKGVDMNALRKTARAAKITMVPLLALVAAGIAFILSIILRAIF